MNFFISFSSLIKERIVYLGKVKPSYFLTRQEWLLLVCIIKSHKNCSETNNKVSRECCTY